MKGSWVSDSNQRGFTLPELMIGIAVTSIISLAFLTAITNYFILITRNNAQIDMTNDSQNLLRFTVENLRVSNGVRQTNSISDPNSPVGGWNTSNTNFVVVMSTPALDSGENYIIDSNTGYPYMNEIVYYKNGSLLMKRNLANPSAVGNTMRTSCPSGSITPTCPGDAKLADYFQSMSFTLYDQNGGLTTDTTLARSIKVNLSMQRNMFGNLLSVNNSIRVALRNNF